MTWLLPIETHKPNNTLSETYKADITKFQSKWDFRLPPQSSQGLCSSRMLCSVDWLSVTDILGNMYILSSGVKQLKISLTAWLIRCLETFVTKPFYATQHPRRPNPQKINPTVSHKWHNHLLPCSIIFIYEHLFMMGSGQFVIILGS